MPSTDLDPTTARNFELFRDCVEAVLIERLSQPTAVTSAKSRRKDRASKRSVRRKSVAQPAAKDIGAEPADDAAELAEFVDYIADATFGSLAQELRTLSREEWVEGAGLAARWAPPVTAAAAVPGGVDPDVAASLAVYGGDEDVVAAATGAYVNAVTSGPGPGQGPPRRGQAVECELCGRDWIDLTYHHLVPRMVHAKAVRRGWRREDELQSVAWLCRACHSAVHRFACHEDLARYYYTVELLMQQDEIVAFARWAARLRWKAK